MWKKGRERKEGDWLHVRVCEGWRGRKREGKGGKEEEMEMVVFILYAVLLPPLQCVCVQCTSCCCCISQREGVR